MRLLATILTSVTRTTDNSTVEISKYVYGIGASSTDPDGYDTITSTESSGSVPTTKTIHISPSYLQAGTGISVVHSNLLQKVSDGLGMPYLEVSQIDGSSGRFDIAYRGRQMQWSPGEYLRYLDENGDVEETYSQHPSVGGGTDVDSAREILFGKPSEMTTESGMTIELKYDDRGNVEEKIYKICVPTNLAPPEPGEIPFGIQQGETPGSGPPGETCYESTERWVYDDLNNEIFYKDRNDYVTRTWRDVTTGKPTRGRSGISHQRCRYNRGSSKLDNGSRHG